MLQIGGNVNDIFNEAELLVNIRIFFLLVLDQHIFETDNTVLNVMSRHSELF